MSESKRRFTLEVTQLDDDGHYVVEIMNASGDIIDAHINPTIVKGFTLDYTHNGVWFEFTKPPKTHE